MAVWSQSLPIFGGAEQAPYLSQPTPPQQNVHAATLPISLHQQKMYCLRRRHPVSGDTCQFSCLRCTRCNRRSEPCAKSLPDLFGVPGVSPRPLWSPRSLTRTFMKLEESHLVHCVVALSHLLLKTSRTISIRLALIILSHPVS